MTDNTEEQIRGIMHHLELMRQMKEQKVSAEDARSACDEAMETWGPIAERLGLSKEQHEMLDIAVEMGYPEDYKELKRLLMESEIMCENVFATFSLPIKAMLDDLGIEYTFQCRMKSVYSTWRKMRVDQKTFDDVYDLFATRIVYKPLKQIEPLVSENEIDAEQGVSAVKADTLEAMDAENATCWRIYTVISTLYRIHPERIKNWITHPKPSGYQALQLTVMGPDCNWIELQIRSERMDYEAEHGSASHWLYKQEKSVK